MEDVSSRHLNLRRLNNVGVMYMHQLCINEYKAILFPSSPSLLLQHPSFLTLALTLLPLNILCPPHQL